MRALLCLAAAAAVLAPACQRDSERTKVDLGDESNAGDETDTPSAKVDPGAAPDEDTRRQPPQRKSLPPPPDVGGIPDDATKTDSGLAYKVLKEGAEDAEKPGRNDTVVLHYTGWNTEGKMFFSTQTRGRPQPMSLINSPPGWVEAVQLLRIGEKRRYWIPPELAYKGPPSAKRDMLVVEMELVEIKKAPEVPENLAAPPRGATRTRTGLAYKRLSKGTGTEKPRWWDTVEIHYTGWDTTGKMFDSTVMRGRARPFMLFRQSKGWQEGIQTMVVGETKRFWVPESLLDERPGQPKGMLVYDIELVKLDKNAKPPPTPKDVARPPAKAKKTDKGVSYRFLAPPKQGPKPAPTNTVVVDFTGWTTDGRMFDSSIVKGQRAEFPLNGVIAGWTDGLQVMSVGDKVRFWIPEELAYKGNPSRPQGMLVFDVELHEIK